MSSRLPRLVVPFAMVASTLVLSGPPAAMAQEAVPDHPVRRPSAVARADVVAEREAARVAGLLRGGEVTAMPVQPASAAPAPSRVQVSAEAAEARRLGLLGSGEATPRPATASEHEAIRRAGRRAAGVETVAGVR